MPKKNLEHKESAFKHWINDQVVDQYLTGLKKAGPRLQLSALQSAKSQLKQLELRQRVRLIAQELKNVLPADFNQAVRILREAVDHQKIEGFALWPATEFVQLYGLKHFDESFEAMTVWTSRFTAEFAVRPFIALDQARALRYLDRATQSSDVHLRRWASEGSRPRLPWGERLYDLVQDPRPGLVLLEKLKFDSELYVRKSVSNHLNDIAKDHPALVIQTLRKWIRQVPKGFENEFQFILKQSLRTLIKSGHPDALKLMGVRAGDPDLKLGSSRVCTRRVSTSPKDSYFEFEVEVKNRSRQKKKFVLDYVIHYLKANGSHSPKTFKFKTGMLGPKESILLKKRHSFRPVTTRQYYSGTQFLEIKLNGQPSKRLPFQLQVV